VRFARAVLAIACAVLAVFMARERKERSDQGVVTVAEQADGRLCRLDITSPAFRTPDRLEVVPPPLTARA
jgi:hypothetical protein